MNNIEVNYKSTLIPKISSTSKCSYSGNNKGDHENNSSGQSFQDILKQKLESRVKPMSNATASNFQVIFNRRLL